MPATPNRPQATPEDEAPREELPVRPDGPGPRDVPDEEVIDKTLPTRGTADEGQPGG